MKLNKITAIGLLSTVAIGSAFALNPMTKKNQGGIHTDVISVPSGKTINTLMKYELGQYNNGSCAITKTLSGHDAEGVDNNETISIEGAGLAQYAGKGLTCMKETYTNTKTGNTKTVEFQLISDAVGNYVGSTPAVSHITLN